MDLQEQLSAALARIAALEALVAAAPLPSAAPPGGGIAIPPRTFSSLDSALATTEERVVGCLYEVATPSLQGASGMACLDVSEPPLAPDLAALSAAPSLQAWGLAMAPDSMLKQERAFPFATAFVPAWVVAQPRPAHPTHGSLPASRLFLKSGAPLPRLHGGTCPAWTSTPGLLTTPRERFHAAFTGAIASAATPSTTDTDSLLFEQLLTYGMQAMLGSYFQDVPTGCLRFFRAPPRAYALAGLAHVGYLVALEWVGKVHGSVVSEPFFLGSPAHQAAVERLPDCPQAGAFVDVDLGGIGGHAWPPQEDAEVSVFWRVQPPLQAPLPLPLLQLPLPPLPPAALYRQQFFKLLPGAATEAPDFRRMHAAYARLQAAWQAGGAAAGGAPPPSLLPAELLFSAGLVGVFMPWVQGRSAARRELGAGGLALAPVVEAIVWLARQGLLYTDLREPNVLVREEGGGEAAAAAAAAAAASVVLTDYDDMLCLQAPPASGEELCALLEAEDTAYYAAPAGVPGALPDIMAALRAKVW